MINDTDYLIPFQRLCIRQYRTEHDIRENTVRSCKTEQYSTSTVQNSTRQNSSCTIKSEKEIQLNLTSYSLSIHFPIATSHNKNSLISQLKLQKKTRNPHLEILPGMENKTKYDK